jgi:peptidoglycan/LPS O-acetylase OafA/YrhL
MISPAPLGFLASEIFTNVILPFLFIFTVVFAILEKTKFISEKKDIHAIIALVFGLAAVGVPWAVGVVLNIIPVVVVIIVILISWLMTYGFLGGYEPGKGISDAWKKTFQIILGIVFIGVIVWSTGAYKLAIDKPWIGQVGETVLLVGAVIAVIAIVVSEKEPSSK